MKTPTGAVAARLARLEAELRGSDCGLAVAIAICIVAIALVEAVA
jgi:hypothetical protein